MTDVEEIVAKQDADYAQFDGEPCPSEWWIPTRDLRALIAAWRTRGVAVNAVIEASRAYLPLDGISKDEFIDRVIRAVDNPEINAAMGGR